MILQTQKAIRTALKADTSFNAKVKEVYGIFAPENVAFPYLTIGDKNDSDFGVFGNSGGEITFLVHVWSQKYKDENEVGSIYEDMRRILRKKMLPVEGYVMVDSNISLVTVLVETDNKIMHLVSRYNCRLKTA